MVVDKIAQLCWPGPPNKSPLILGNLFSSPCIKPFPNLQLVKSCLMFGSFSLTVFRKLASLPDVQCYGLQVTRIAFGLSPT